MGAFLGFVQAEASISLPVLVKSSAGVPVNADAAPAYRIYGPAGVLLTGGMVFKDSGTITGATNANPIVITCADHGLSTGTVVTITGVAGNTNANGTFVVTRINANTFSIPVAGNGAYTSGGTWNVAGLYHVNLAATGANGFVAGATYTLLATALVSAANWADLSTFTVT